MQSRHIYSLRGAWWKRKLFSRSRTFTRPIFAKIRHYCCHGTTYRPMDPSSAIPRDGAGERTRFFWWRTACNTWQYLVSGPWSPAGNRDVFPYARPLPFAANGSGGHAEAKRRPGTHRGRRGGLTVCFPFSPLQPPRIYPRLVACLRE